MKILLYVYVTKHKISAGFAGFFIWLFSTCQRTTLLAQVELNDLIGKYNNPHMIRLNFHITILVLYVTEKSPFAIRFNFELINLRRRTERRSTKHIPSK